MFGAIIFFLLLGFDIVAALLALLPSDDWPYKVWFQRAAGVGWAIFFILGFIGLMMLGDI